MLLNYKIHPKDIVISNKVWICAKTTILKGAKISEGSVVGCGSIVNKEFSEPNCIIAGIPAKITKREIAWDKRNIKDWEKLNSF